MSFGTALLNIVLVAFRLSAIASANLVARDLHVQNAVLAPDGFSRSFVALNAYATHLNTETGIL